MSECPMCKGVLKEQQVVKLKNDTKEEIVGYHKFCDEDGCKYETKTYGKKVIKNGYNKRRF